LGGNSLLAAMYSGNVAAKSISEKSEISSRPNFDSYINERQDIFKKLLESESPFAAMHIRDMLSATMRENMSIVRNRDLLTKGMDDISFYLSIVDRIHYDPSASAYTNYSLKAMLSLALAVLTCAEARKESRGAHYRSDYPGANDEYLAATLISYDDGNYRVTFDREMEYEN
jgi:succinate dehydrogenase / fumarate reductase flavoprotein subunit